MPDWQERIDRHTHPAIRAEHELRYAAAAPLVHAAAAWCDLGCGVGLGAAAGLATPYEGCAVLVDVEEAAVAEARRNVEARETVGLTADLTDPEDLRRVRAALLDAAPDGRRAVTCFEVIEHLATFAPLVELLVELAGEQDCSIVLSVPNDAFWSLENPHHATMWGEGAVEELRRLLPADHVLMHQVALQGSALARVDEQIREVTEATIGAGTPSHFVIAFGPDAARLGAAPRIVQADLEAQRHWERQRESDLRVLEATHAQLAEFRAYIHELEGRLGLPRSGEQ